MQSDTTMQDFVFGEFRLSTHRQALHRSGEPVSMSTKPYQLLLVLVSQAGQVLSKDELIAAAWPGQIVTDVALARQLTRVRKLIGDQDRHPPWIETVRGFGYRFTAPVERVEASAEPETHGRVARPFTWGLAAVLALGAMIVLWRLPDDSESLPIPAAMAAPPVSVAVLSPSAASDWLNTGGVQYLTELIAQQGAFASIEPDAASLESAAPDEMAIELMTQGNLQYVCMVTFSEGDFGYRSQVALRNEDGLLATDTLESPHLGNLFDELGRWVSVRVAEHERLAGGDQALPVSLDSYAVQSYLQALHELETGGDYGKASEFLQAAVRKDPDFLLARVQLARTHLDAGELDTAIALSRTLLQRTELTDRPVLAAQLHTSLGMALMRKGDNDAAQEHLERSRALLEDEADPFLQISGLYPLQLQATMAQEFDDAADIVSERLELAETHYPLPNFLGQLHIELATLLFQASRMDESKANIDAALRLYEGTGNADGLVKAYWLTTNHYFTVNDMERAARASRLAQPFLDQTTVFYEKAFFFAVAGQAFNVMGDFEAADDQVERLRALAEEENNPIYTTLSEFIKLHQYYVQEEFDQGLTYARVMLEALKRDNPSHALIPDTEAILITLSARSEPPRTAAERIEQFAANYPEARERVTNDLRRAEAHIALRQGRTDEGLRLLEESRNRYRGANRRHLATYIGYELLQALLDHPERPHQELLTSLESEGGYNYLLYRLKAQFLARDGDYLQAVAVLEENKLRANQLWRPPDQLLLEDYRSRIQNPESLAQSNIED